MLELLGQCRNLAPVVGDKTLLITGVPQPRDVSFDKLSWQDGHLKMSVRHVPEFRTATIFLYAYDSARAAHLKAFRGQGFEGRSGESFLDIPHGD